MKRRQLIVRGIVQGVGFRPFVYNLANQLGISGWICNTNQGVCIEAQANPETLDRFVHLLHAAKPQNALIEHLDISHLQTIDEAGFSIKKSDDAFNPETAILPDLATCADCLKEVMSPENRRFRYPFTNCTNCGPRFTIIEKLPYDRQNTTMKTFEMCPACREEYNNPADRRFHAQPNACPDCGPQLLLCDSMGNLLAEKDKALKLAAKQIKNGAILAIKGIGGFQLIVDASNEKSVEELRKRKQRGDKPFALMYPDIDLVKKQCRVSKLEEELLLSQQAPIVLLQGKVFPSPNISPSNPYLGVMLPTTALHSLLLQELNFPVVATSGNRSEEPICIDEKEALADLKGIADFFLVHDRPIVRYVDDSLVKVVANRKLILRRSRGYASIPLKIDDHLPPSLAVGGHMKNTVAAAKGDTIYISQHIGDLENQKAVEGFTKEINSLLTFYGIKPDIVVSDIHPDYYSTKFAAKLQKPLIFCQHHIAHVYSCMAENRLSPPLFGVSWDGTGYGLDKTVWGGEFFHLFEDFSYKRAAHLRPFPLPCGEKAMKEPRLSAIGILYEIYGEALFEMKDLHPIKNLPDSEALLLRKILSSGFQTVKCSSMGRVFDAVSSLMGFQQKITFEGQAAMQLEFLSENHPSTCVYPWQLNDLGIDWEPMIRQIIEEIISGNPQNEIAAKFHNTLAGIVVEMAKMAGQKKVVLSGGVFQNKVLTEKTVGALRHHHFEPYWHEEIPPNDGGVSLGQLYSLCRAAACV